MAYNKLNIFYLALTEKECFRLELELSFEWVSLEAQLPAVVRENEPVLKRKARFRRRTFHEPNLIH